MSSKPKRVVLLARPGAAGQRLAEVLGEAGAELVLHADPTQVDAATIREASPDTLLVALDAPTEDALDRLDEALNAPAVNVIYEEAALVVAREGWDAARWRRHLMAKLQGHDNVLPPVSGDGAGVVDASTTSNPNSAMSAETTPAEEAIPVASGPGPTVVAEETFAGFSIQQTYDPVDQPLPDGTAVADTAAEPPHATLATSMNWTLDPGPVAMGSVSDAPVNEAAAAESPVDEPTAAAGPAMEDGAAYGLALSLDGDVPPAMAAVVPPDEGAGVDALDFNAFDPVFAETSETTTSPEATARWAEQAFVTEPESVATTVEDRFSTDLASLELRIASMSLVDDTPVRGPEKVRGAVLVLAGIGGPDAVRQLLGGLPADFVRPVIVRQRLDGARYDRLVAQMQRATTLPVKLAEPGQPVEQGTVYILPDTVGVLESGGALAFQEGANDLLVAVPAADSAVLMLSGSDPAQVDAALSFGWNGGMVIGQNVDGCYDAAAVNDLAARGGTVAKPAEMGARLAAHWQRGG